MRKTALCCLVAAGLAAVSPLGVAEEELFTAVSAKAYNGYVRARQPDGTLKPETYAFGQGTYHDGQIRDPSIEGYPFLKLARLIAPYLAGQHYVPTPGRDQTDLIIMVHWGTTIPGDTGFYRNAIDSLSMSMSNARWTGQTFGMSADAQQGKDGPMGAYPLGTAGQMLQDQMESEVASALLLVQMANRQRDMADARNAALLGYLPEMNRLGELRAFFPGVGARHQDLVSDVEEDRYFVILAAYDFRTAWKEKKLKLLWVTRVSISVRGHRFDQHVDGMLAAAAQYFGRGSPGLLRGFAPEGKVKIGEPKVLGVVPDGRK